MLTRQREAQMRHAFEQALALLNSGEEIAYGQILESEIGTSAVILVAGTGITYDVISVMNSFMSNADLERSRVAIRAVPEMEPGQARVKAKTKGRK